MRVVVDVQEVAVVERLQAEVVELQVARCVERGAELGEVVLRELLVEELRLDAALDEGREVVGVAGGHLRLRHLLAEDLAADRVQQQARGGAGVAGLFLDQGARGEDGGLVDLVDRHAVVQVAARLGEHGLGGDVRAQVRAGRVDQRAQGGRVERHALALVGDEELGLGDRDRRLAAVLALLRTALAIQHVGTRHFVVATAHQPEFDVVLHVLDVEGAAARARAQQRAHHGLGQRVHGLAHARRGCPLRAVHREERLHQGHRDLARLERDHRAVAAQDLVALVGRIATGDGVFGGRRAPRRWIR